MAARTILAQIRNSPISTFLALIFSFSFVYISTLFSLTLIFHFYSITLLKVF